MTVNMTCLVIEEADQIQNDVLPHGAAQTMGASRAY